MIRSLFGHLIQYARNIADHAHGHASIAADLQRRGVDLDDLRAGCNVGRPAKADGEVLFATQQHDDIGVADLGGGAIQASLEKSEGVRMIVGNRAARLLFRKHR